MAIKGAYWRSSEAQRFPPSSIPANYFTHIFYATVVIDDRTNKLSVSTAEGQLMDDFTSKLHQKKLKCVLSIGLATTNPNSLSSMARTPDGRATFIQSSIDTARKHGFDGLDLYWKYPGSAEDMRDLSSLFLEWKGAIKGESSDPNTQLSLSAVVYFAANKFFPLNNNIPYPFQAIINYVDFVNVVCYDYCGFGSEDTKKTAENALLYDQPGKKSTDFGISSWIKHAKVPVEKLVMGLPLYGRTWSLADPNENGIGAPAVRFGLGNGVLEYDAILQFNNNEGATVKNDESTASAYSYSGMDWIGYDNPISVGTKVQYASTNKLAGYFFWAIGMDSKYALPAAGGVFFFYIVSRFQNTTIALNQLNINITDHMFC